MRLMCRQLHLLAICVLLLMATSNGYSYKEVKSWRINHSKQGNNTDAGRAATKEMLLWTSMSVPGSHPPKCARKCGLCTPCRPVRVSVPPGAIDSAEYYPEAWWCKCRNHLYIP